MSTHPNLRELPQWVAEMLSLEAQIEEALGRFQEDVRDHSGTAAAIKSFRTTVKGQQAALQQRLQAMDVGGVGNNGSILPFAMAAFLPNSSGPYTVSRALHIVSTAFNHAAFGYAMLHTVAHRNNDRMGQENTAEMAEQHQRFYIDASKTIYQLIPDVVIWEMGQEGECRCTCPSCSLGICLCWHSHIDSFMPISPAGEGGIVLRPPKVNSVALQGGLQPGDVILAVNGRGIQAYQDLQSEIRKHQPGDEIQLQILRGPSDLCEVPITVP